MSAGAVDPSAVLGNLVRRETLAVPATLYRVGRASDSQGLWYGVDGGYVGDVHRLRHGPAAALPMGLDPVFRAEGRRWISVTESLETLRHWFSRADMEELLPQGYEVQEIRVAEYRRLTFETYAHEVYSEDHLVGRRAIDPRSLYADA